MDSSEQRLTRLEENGYFMETRLKALDEQIAEQQAQLGNLAKSVERLQAKMGEIRDFLAQTRSGSQEEPTPPHHIAKFW